MSDDRDDVEGDSPHVEEHNGDVENRREYKNPLALEEAGEEDPDEALRERLGRRAGGFGAAGAVARGAAERGGGGRRLRAALSAAREPMHRGYCSHRSNDECDNLFFKRGKKIPTAIGVIM